MLRVFGAVTGPFNLGCLSSFRLLLALLSLIVTASGHAFAQYGRYEGEPTYHQEQGNEQTTSEENLAELTEEQEEQATPEPPSDPDPMGSIGIGVKIGYLHFGHATFSGANVTVSSKQLGSTQVVENQGVPARSGMLLSIPIYLGGSGFGWVLDPYLGFGEIGSYGIFTGPLGHFHVSTNTYLGLGFGLRLGNITTNFDDTKTGWGIDLYGRIPFSVVYYPVQDFAVLFELGIGYGATGYKPATTQQTVTPGVTVPNVKLQFGPTYEIDFSVGVRLP